ncbi:LysR family transcriptional regulator [Spirosoma telluris]|uniref:LysR family transcriptional regulator n=1 Tax=Spirosoma telluris TaxID=2183553 RepID=UPI002FC3DBEC
MNIDTIALQCFIAVAETGSFTKAAERVNRTQSAISQQITKLENLLGKLLLVRGKAFTLTPEGEIFLGYARRIFALHREALDRFKEPELEGKCALAFPRISPVCIYPTCWLIFPVFILEFCSISNVI